MQPPCLHFFPWPLPSGLPASTFPLQILPSSTSLPPRPPPSQPVSPRLSSLLGEEPACLCPCPTAQGTASRGPMAWCKCLHLQPSRTGAVGMLLCPPAGAQVQRKTLFWETEPCGAPAARAVRDWRQPTGLNQRTHYRIMSQTAPLSHNYCLTLFYKSALSFFCGTVLEKRGSQSFWWHHHVPQGPDLVQQRRRKGVNSTVMWGDVVKVNQEKRIGLKKHEFLKNVHFSNGKREKRLRGPGRVEYLLQRRSLSHS